MGNKRIFIFENREFPDPNPEITPDEVRQQMANFIPDLANAETKTETKDGIAYYIFERRVGTKGAGTLDLDKLPGAAPNLYYALKALVDDAHYSQELKSWSIGPMSDEVMGRLWLARTAISQAES